MSTQIFTRAQGTRGNRGTTLDPTLRPADVRCRALGHGARVRGHGESWALAAAPYLGESAPARLLAVVIVRRATVRSTLYTPVGYARLP